MSKIIPLLPKLNSYLFFYFLFLFQICVVCLQPLFLVFHAFDPLMLKDYGISALLSS
jgi:hypothetical protein